MIAVQCIFAVLVALTSAVAPATASSGPTISAPMQSEFPYPPTTYSEPHCGQFHFSSQSGCMNDPNGLLH